MLIAIFSLFSLAAFGTLTCMALRGPVMRMLQERTDLAAQSEGLKAAHKELATAQLAQADLTIKIQAQETAHSEVERRSAN